MKNNINYIPNLKTTNKFNRTRIEKSETLSEIIEEHLHICYGYIEEIEVLISSIYDILFAMEDKLNQIE